MLKSKELQIYFSQLTDIAVRFLKHLNLYENQLIAKIQNFETDNLDDLNNFEYKKHIEYILNRCA